MALRHVVIIGAGIVGAISANEALDQGFHVTILEPGMPGGDQAASFGNAAWLSTHSVVPPSEPGMLARLPRMLLDPAGPVAVSPLAVAAKAPWLMRFLRSNDSVEKIENTARDLRSLIDGAVALHKERATAAGLGQLIRDDGVLHVYTSREAWLAEALGWRLRAENGIAWEQVSEKELRAREPDLSPRYKFAICVGESGQCTDPGAYVAGLVAYAQRRGARLVAAAATDFVFDAERLLAVQTTKGQIACDAAIIAAGIASGELARKVGSPVPLESERGYHVSIGQCAVGPRTTTMFNEKKFVVSPIAKGVRVAGQVEITFRNASPNWKRANLLKKQLGEAYPALADRLRDEAGLTRWMGNRPSTPDGRPCIGYSARSRDVVLAFGHGHIGLVSSPKTALLALQLLTGRKTSIDIQPFSPARFH